MTKDALLDKAAETFATLESVDADVDMNYDMNISADGMSMDMSMSADMNVVSDKENASHLTGDMEMKMLGQDMDMDIETYTVKEGDEYIAYSKVTGTGVDEGNWTYRKIDDPGTDSSEMSVSQIADAYNQLKDSLSDLTLQSGTVSYNGENCYLISGTIPGEKFAELAKKAGQDMSSEGAENLKLMDLDTEVYFKASDQTPYAMVMDLSKAIENMIKSQAGDQLGSYDISANESKISVVFNELNGSTDIVVPDDVKQSATESEDSIDVQDMLFSL